jgi:hypothetical protein
LLRHRLLLPARQRRPAPAAAAADAEVDAAEGQAAEAAPGDAVVAGEAAAGGRANVLSAPESEETAARLAGGMQRQKQQNDHRLSVRTGTSSNLCAFVCCRRSAAHARSNHSHGRTR